MTGYNEKDEIDTAADAEIARLRAEIEALTADRAEKSAAEKALDEIAAACGCEKWEYPGQVVNDVLAEVNMRKAAEAKVTVYGNLVAILNGDGGHRQSEVGVEVAVGEAKERWYETQRRAEDAVRCRRLP